MNSLTKSGKMVSRLAIAAAIAGLFAVPHVRADSMAGGAASSETGGPQQSQSTSSATTQNTTSAGGASTSSSITQNSSKSSTSNVSNAGDGPVGQALSRQTVKTTGVQVKSARPARRNTVVSSTATVRNHRRPAKKWKTVNYNYRTGSKTVVNKTVVR